MLLARSSLLWLALLLLAPAGASAAVQPSLTASGSDAQLGGSVHATATLSGGQAPTGSITFSAFAASDPTCAQAAVFTSTVPVNDNDEYDSADFTPTAAGTYHWSAEYGGDSENEPASSLCVATSTIAKATTSLSSVATSAVVGAAIHDTATLSGGVNPTGALTFKAFAPGDTSCSGGAAYTKTVSVTGNGPYGSEDFTPAAAGAYRWTISYSGDADNEPSTSPCNSANETSTVSLATPSLSSTATGGAAGGTIKDSATLSGGFSPTGTLTFKAFGPENTTCSGGAAYTKTVSVTGNGSYGSEDFANPSAGEYRWTIVYSGDANNNPATSPCNAANETSVVAKASPTISTTATSASIGAAIKDTATIASGASPTGKVKFKAFGPNDTNCTGGVAFSAEVNVSGNAAYESGPFTPSSVGAYRWTAEYTGDANNNAVTSPCNAANETSNVTGVTPSLSSTAADGTAGGTISDSATLSGGVNPTGKLVFKAFGPNDPTCTGAVAFSAEVTVTANKTYESGNFTNPLAGQYRWTVSYSGDGNNGATSSACNAANETSTVAKATPTLSSTAVNGGAGGTISDSATLAAGAAPTGTLTFKAFGPNDPTCTGAVAFTSAPVAVSGNKAYESGSFTNPLAGAYRWTVEYTGDANNNAATSACNAPNETSTVAKATPTITGTTATSGVVGAGIKDAATLTGVGPTGVGPTGTLTFKAFGPNDAACATPVFSEGVTVGGSKAYESGPFATSAPGGYRWRVEYTGDANNNAVTSPCTAANESTVSKTSPTIASTAASSIYPNPISDTATINGAFSPTGSLVFKAFGPNDANCSNPAAYEETVLLSVGKNTYGSGGFPTVQIGEYRWTISYAGDANNNAATSPCNAANETSVVAKVPPQITVSTADAGIGGAIASFATFGGAPKHVGTITLRAYPPGDATCAGSPAFAATLAVTESNNTYASGQFMPATAGAYRWTASYSGDATNAAETTACGAAVATVAPATPVLATHISAASITAGDSVHDTATITAGYKPTGALTFKLFGPGDTACSGSPALTSTVPVTGNGSFVSGNLVPRAAGDYRFTISYSGDASNTAVVAACGAGGEFVQVQKRTPTLKAKASVRGKKIVAQATLGGADSPQGKVTFRIYGPGDKRCTRKPVFTSQRPVHGVGSYSAGYKFESGGLYHFTVAYSGDERNKSLKKGCASRGQSIRVP